jgi:S-DNA-T family DNA segregation ATPase FtsK/SpoIIIE
MFKKSAKKNSLELKVKISYDEKTDTINIQSKDRRRRSSRKLDLSLKGLEADYNLHNLHYFLEREGMISEGRFQTVPENLNHTHAINTEQWDKFPLGRFADGEEVIWDTSLSSNLLLSGGVGTGKSVLQRNILNHCLRHSENWVLYGFDPFRVEMVPYLKNNPVVAEITTEISDTAAMITRVHAEMNKRYKQLKETGTKNFRDLPTTLPALMIMINETSYLLSTTGSKSDEGKMEDSLREEMKYQLADIARLGHAAGIHLVISTERMDSGIFPTVFKEDFTTRIALGRMQGTESQILLGSDKTKEWAGAIKGRGYFQQFGEGYDFQAYYADKDLNI